MEKFYKRYLKMDLPAKQSAFLWGARKTGKSTYLKSHFKGASYYDLLNSEVFLRYLKEPHVFREEVLGLPQDKLKHPIIVDEVQKVPMLLDEIHWLIENANAQFILCGSSARKLRSTGVNLLGGRAWRYHFYPLVFPEIDNFDLLKVFNHGTIPSHYNSTNIKKSLQAYVEDYLNEEIKAEGLVRNLPAFTRFFDNMGFSHGEPTNYTNIARECGVNAKTVKEYYQILVDTLLGYLVLPYQKKVKRDIILSIPKFYLFDVGVANFIAKRKIEILKDINAGKALEHYILTELVAYRGLNDLDYEISYWRTKTGLEVDFILGKAAVAIEVKISDRIQKSDLKGLVAFAQEHKTKNLYLVCQERRPRKIVSEGIDIFVLPTLEFLKSLWGGKII
ncbi:MAG: AAA family ATPase [Alphaproteobacteria bacterium 41-28]|nr:MAG: AAA family ATPase [Alphaproteobacteria bacterium 41-28]